MRRVADAALRLIGVELYFDDLTGAKRFYQETLGLRPSEESAGEYVKMETDFGFLCLERKGTESYPSCDKAVLFFEVPDLMDAIARIGSARLVRSEANWAVLHDPEGHNILLLQADRVGSSRRTDGREASPSVRGPRPARRKS